VLSRAKHRTAAFLARYQRKGHEPSSPSAPVPERQADAAAERTTTSNAVTARWDRLADEEFVRDLTRRSWTGIPEIHQNHNFRVTGDRNSYWVTWLRDNYFAGGAAGDALSLGCGEGHLDRIFKDCGFVFRSFTGLDISPRAVDRARELAAERGGLAPVTTYATADLNVDTLPKDAFDFIYFFQSLHHIERLEHILGQCAGALRAGGLLMVNEFVGPSRFQWTPLQKSMADTLIGLLPADLRVDLLAGDGRLKTVSVAPTVEEMILGDPSESVRSGDIERVLRQYFDVIADKPWGGTLTYLIFENIAGNFDPTNPYHRSIVELLIHHENQLIDLEVLPSDFKLLLARPRPS
jgi:SAM-dependent methyltransferase